MTTLQQLQESARKKFEKSEVLERIRGVESIAQAHGARQYEGETVQDFLDQIIASTIEEVRKAIVMPEREDGIFIPMEMTKSECLDKGWEMYHERMSRRFTELTSEQKEGCDHDFSIMLASMPPQYKCSECGEIRKNP